MRKTALVLTAASWFVTMPAVAATTIAYAPGSNALGNNQIIFQSFDKLGPTGQNSVVLGASVLNQGTKPAGSTTGFLAVGNTATSFPDNFGSYSLDLPKAAPVVSFLLGTLDSYNTVTLNYVNGISKSYSGNAIIGGVPFTGDGRVTFDVSSANPLNFIKNITFISTQPAFELDDVASAAPEPATWLTMILGFGLIGTALRRRRRPSSAVA